MIESLINDVEDNDKQLQVIKGDFLTAGYDTNAENGEISLMVQDEITRLGRENIKETMQNKEELSNLKSLFSSVKELKKNIT